MPKDLNRFKLFPETLVAYHGQSLLVTGIHGQIRERLEGFYLHQTRFLQLLDLSLDGLPLTFVSANPVDAHSFLSYYLAPTPAGRAAGPPPDGGGELVEKGLSIQLNGFVGNGLHLDLLLTTHALLPADLTLSLRFGADFADLSEALSGVRLIDFPVQADWHDAPDARELRLRYLHPKLSHETLLRFPLVQGGPHWEDGQVRYRLHLEPQTPVRLCVFLHPIFCGERYDPLFGCDAFRLEADPVTRTWLQEAARLETPQALVQEAWDRALADLASLALLEGQGAERYTPAAGIPRYQALFGRDTLTSSWQAGLIFPPMLRGTLLTLAQWVGRTHDERYDEQPGRIIHQHQRSPLALLGRTPYLHYYGDYAGPGLFLIALGWDFMLTGDREFQRRMRDTALRVLEWMDRDGDRDGDGFYEYDTRAGDWGAKNQGWKDSPEAILYPDGRCVPNPVAAVEIQGYDFVAKQLMGQTFLAMGEIARGLDLLRQAESLKRRFNEAFWLPEGALALALDPEKRQVATMASNMGHCLACGIVDATGLFAENRLPEAMGGHPRDRAHPHPGIYPQSCAPQAWSASAIPMLIQALLGLRVYAPLNTVLIDPCLPEWLPEVTLHQIPVGASRISLQFRRDALGHTDYRILAARGHPHVLRQPPANHLKVGVLERLEDLVASLPSHLYPPLPGAGLSRMTGRGWTGTWVTWLRHHPRRALAGLALAGLSFWGIRKFKG